MILTRVAICSRAPTKIRSAAPARRASGVTTTASKATLPSNPEHLAKLQKALDSGDAKSVVEVAAALNKLSSSLSHDQRSLLQNHNSADLKEVEATDAAAATSLKAFIHPHEQLRAALPEWHNPRGYHINTVEELEQHWQKYLKSHSKGMGEQALQQIYAEGKADATKVETQLFQFFGGLATLESKEQAVDYFKKNLPEFLDRPYVLGRPNPLYQGPPIGPQPKDLAWNSKRANATAGKKPQKPWLGFLQNYLNYLVDDGLVNPAVLKQMYQVDLALAAQNPEAVNYLVQQFEQAFQRASTRFSNPAKVNEVFGQMKERIAGFANGTATLDSFHMSSLNDDKVQERFEDLIKNHPTFKNLDWETKLNVARNYDLSLGYQTLEWTWPSPPPAHTWVELPQYKPVDDGHHHHHGDDHKH